MINKLKITTSTTIENDLGYFQGKASYCKFNIIDANDDIYESEVYLPEDWEFEDFTKLITKSFHLCSSIPEEVMIMQFRHQTNKEIKLSEKN